MDFHRIEQIICVKWQQWISMTNGLSCLINEKRLFQVFNKHCMLAFICFVFICLVVILPSVDSFQWAYPIGWFIKKFLWRKDVENLNEAWNTRDLLNYLIVRLICLTVSEYIRRKKKKKRQKTILFWNAETGDYIVFYIFETRGL